MPTKEDQVGRKLSKGHQPLMHGPSIGIAGSLSAAASEMIAASATRMQTRAARDTSIVVGYRCLKRWRLAFGLSAIDDLLLNTTRFYLAAPLLCKRAQRAEDRAFSRHN